MRGVRFIPSPCCQSMVAEPSGPPTPQLLSPKSTPSEDSLTVSLEERRLEIRRLDDLPVARRRLLLRGEEPRR